MSLAPRWTALALLPAVLIGTVHADIIEMGDLNIIDDPGNPSDGLQYLDMTYSDGLTLAAALTNAQGTYSNARVATAAEFDNLIAASDIVYDGALTASDSFIIGTSLFISTGTNYDGGVLQAQLGLTDPDQSLIWSDPDGSTSSGTTRDFLDLRFTGLVISQFGSTPPHDAVGWLLVSDASAVPEPTSLALLGFGAIGLIGCRRRKRQRAV